MGAGLGRPDVDRIWIPVMTGLAEEMSLSDLNARQTNNSSAPKGLF